MAVRTEVVCSRVVIGWFWPKTVCAFPALQRNPTTTTPTAMIMAG